MLRSLLVPLDGSKLSEFSLPIAGDLAQRTGAALHLAHVHTPYEPDQLLFTTPFQFEHVSLAEYDTKHRVQEESYMTDLADGLSREGTSVDTAILDGTEIVAELIDYADRVATDMIVMSSRGRSGVRRMWLGSVADAMLRRTSVPLIVVHPTEKGATVTRGDGRTFGRHLLVALDGSTLAESVLGPAAELAHATGGHMTLVRVVGPHVSAGEMSALSGAGYADTSTAEAIRYLEQTAESIRGEGMTVATRVATGSAPALALARMVHQLGADLVAIATHGYGGIARTALGSVADQLLRSSPVPILVMRPSLAA
jgi:nucleotide-binding universal stress UspA family protein